MRIAKPRPEEPIRLVETKRGTRYRAVLTVGRHADGRRRQVTTTHLTLGEARDWVSETRLNVKRGAYNAPDRTDVDALCTAWASSKRDVRPVTLNTYESVLKPVRRRLGGMKVQGVRRSDVETFVTWLGSEGGRHGLGVSHRTTSLTLQVLKSVFAFAVSEGIVQTSPAADVKPPRKRPEDHRQIAIWSEAQLDRFVDHADLDRWGGLWRLTACELRRSEVCGLRWEDVDLDSGTVTVRQGRVAFGSTVVTDAPKSRASARTVPVELARPGTVALLRALRRQQAEDRIRAGASWHDTGYVLIDALGRPMHPDHYGRRFREVCLRAGVTPIRLHDVRHSVATILNEKGVPPVWAAAFGGHEVNTYLSTYVTSTQDGVNQAAAALSRGARLA